MRTAILISIILLMAGLLGVFQARLQGWHEVALKYEALYKSADRRAAGWEELAKGCMK